MSMGHCKGCGKLIVWVKTAAGKNMPCDHELVSYWAKEKAVGKVVTPNGEVLSCEFVGEPNEATGVGYISHYATCPQATNFKKRR